MIATLCAEEFRSTRKTLFTSVGVAALIALASFAAVALRVPILGTIGTGLGFFTSFLVTPLVLGLLVENYWRTMYGREGYFTMVLPVRGRDLFTAKVLYALAAALAAVVVTLVLLAAGAMAVSLSQGGGAFDMLRELLIQLRNTISAAGPAMSAFVVFALLLQLVFLVVVGASLMSIGAQARFNYLGFGAPVLGAVIVYFAMQVLGLAAMLFIPLGIRVDGPDAGSFVATGMFEGFVAAVTDPSGQTQPGVVGIGIVFLSLAVTVLFAWWGARSVERHTSLR